MGFSGSISASVVLHAVLIAAALIFAGSSSLREEVIMRVFLLEKTTGNSEKELLTPRKQKEQTEKTLLTDDRISHLPADTIEDNIIRDKKKVVKSTHMPPEPIASGDTARHYEQKTLSPGTDLTSTQADIKFSGDNMSEKYYEKTDNVIINATASSGRQKKHVDQSFSILKIRALIEKNLVYPYIALKRQMEGTVLAEFSINAAGRPEKIRITKSSGFSILDSAAEKTIIKASPFPVVAGSIEIPITFRLEKGR